MAPRPTSALAALERKKVLRRFIKAAKTGNLDLFKKLAAQLDFGRGLTQTVSGIRDANERGVLHIAAGDGQTEICQYIIAELNLDVDCKDGEGDTPLLHAVLEGHVTTAKYLIDRGADPAATNEMGITALHYAAEIGNLELVRLLLSKGLDVNSQSEVGTPLIRAVGNDQTDAVKLLLEHQADPHIVLNNEVDAVGLAAAAGSLSCLELLIQAGGRVNTNVNGATPLHIAAHTGNPGIINCFLKAGADPNAREEKGLKPVQIAANLGHRNAVQILLPITSQISSLPESTVDEIIKCMKSITSTVDEIIKCMKSITGREQENNHKRKVHRDAVPPETDQPEVSAEAKEKAAEEKSRGRDAFIQKNYLAAIVVYTKASDYDPTDATLLSNRSFCWLLLGQAKKALVDAKACRILNPDWPKAFYREGAALRLLQKFDEAAKAFFEAMMLGPENKEVVDAFREAMFAGRVYMLGDYFQTLADRMADMYSL